MSRLPPPKTRRRHPAPPAPDPQLDPTPLPPSDELDLHTFRPKDVSSVVRSYLQDSVEQGYTQVRIIHGKGKGVQRRIVHGILEEHPAVAHFRLGGQGEGSWGATVVNLHPPD